jgi:pimeloyl-ACP methyl ester carboxylesterase
LREITAPTLITWGFLDKLLIPTNGRRLSEDLPNATYIEYPDLAHMPHEEAPDRVGPEWAAFLQR